MYRYIIGVDEVGRGPLAGPVVVCACAMKVPDYKKASFKGLTDSKQMTSTAREEWYERAKRWRTEGKCSYVLSRASATQIDRDGIAVCIKRCINRAIQKLELNPRDCLVLLDGGLYAPAEYSQRTIIKGDAKKKIISLAAVIAKVSRDAYMHKLHKKHPAYDWEHNVGYGTSAHRKAIRIYGATELHRKTFLSRVLDKIQK